MKVESSKDSLTDAGNDTKSYKIFLLLSFLLGFGLTVTFRLFNLTKYGLWQDEVFSLRVAKLDWNSLFQTVIRDAVHPPLFYILLKLWIAAGGESLLWLKTFPFIFAVGSIGALYLLCRNLTIKFAEFSLAVLFISLNAYLIYYAQELRMYSLLAFLSLLSMALFAKFLKGESNTKPPLIILFVVNLLLVYTHYFGWFTVLAECAITFIYGRPKLKSFLVQTFAVGLCFLPWGILVISAMLEKDGLAQNLGWIDKPGLYDVTYFLAELDGTLAIKHAAVAGFLIFLPPLFIWLWQIYKDRTREDLIIFASLGLVTAIPILVAYFVSQIFATSIWVDRYLIAAAIPYILLLAVSVSRIKNIAVRRVFLTLMICWSLGVGFWNVVDLRTRVNWISFSKRIAERENVNGQPAKVFVLEDWTGMPLQQLLDANGTRQLTVQKVVGIEQIGERDFWLAYRQTTWKEQETPNEKLHQMNCSIDEDLVDVIKFDSVHLLLVGCNK